MAVVDLILGSFMVVPDCITSGNEPNMSWRETTNNFTI